MFGGLGGALKDITGKAGEMIDSTKQKVGELAAEKKAAAAAMLEQQANKTKEALFQAKGDAAQSAETAIDETKAAAIDQFDQEVATAGAVVDSTLNEQAQGSPVDPSAPGAGFDASSLLAGGGLGGIDKQVEQTVDGAIKQVSQSVDTKIKETDQIIDTKRDEVLNTAQQEASTAASGITGMLGKARGLINF